MTARASRLLLAVAACTSPGEGIPRLTVAVDGDLRIELLREPDHVFTGLHATTNGVDAGNAELADGAARFEVPAVAGPDLHVEVDDGGDAFVVDVPNLLAPRAVTMGVPATLRVGDPIAISTGVATDALEVALYAKRDDAYCVLDNEGNAQRGTAWVAFPLAIDQAWRCGDPPAPGTSVAITVEARVKVSAPVATCSPGLTCEITGLPQPLLDRPAMLAF